MTKKIFIYLFLILFTTSISAEEIIMRCGKNTYKYIKGETADNILWKNSYWTKNKYEQWCSDKIKQKNTESREGIVLIVKDKKGTCMVKKHKYKYEGKIMTRSNSVSVNDFAKLTRYSEWYHSNTGNTKNTKKYNCKKKKK